jgi:hypothetical protein
VAKDRGAGTPWDNAMLKTVWKKQRTRFAGEMFDNTREYIIMSDAPFRNATRGILTTFGQM